MSKALYRKYRPKTLSEVVGQDQVTDILSKSLLQNKISHAYLFIGPRGTGKTSVARIFAHEINGFSYEIEDEYVDIIEIDGASNRGIDNIRELREKALIAPTAGKYKVYIIDEVHMLTKEAFNALLKILEEPPKHIVFIMATTDAHKVPITITSRAQTYVFSLAKPEVMLTFLKSVADKEKIEIDNDALALIVKRGGGSFRDSLSLLDQISTLSSGLITKDMVVTAMGLPEDEKIHQLLALYLKNDLRDISASLRGLLSSGVRPETLAEEIITLIIENPRTEYLQLLEKLPSVKAPFAEAKLLVALSSRSMSESPTSSTSIPETKKKEPQETPLVKKSSVDNFDWDDFIEKVRAVNDAIAAQLSKTTYELSGGILKIYPEKRIIKSILSRDNNKKVLMGAVNGIKIEVVDIKEKEIKDETLTKISDIMGGEVKNDGGESPF